MFRILLATGVWFFLPESSAVDGRRTLQFAVSRARHHYGLGFKPDECLLSNLEFTNLRMSDDLIRNAQLLRRELSARNTSYASLQQLPHTITYGETPAVLYQQSGCGGYHGNFISASYRAILCRA